jgi:hypothetical protein
VLDAVDAGALSRLPFRTIRKPDKNVAQCLAKVMQHVITLLLAAVDSSNAAPANEQLALCVQRGVILLHLLPSLLLSPDGRLERTQRCKLLERGDLTDLVKWQIEFATKTVSRAETAQTPAQLLSEREKRWATAADAVSFAGGVQKAAQILTSEARSPRNAATLVALRLKHPTEEPADIAAALQAARQSTAGLRFQHGEFCTAEAVLAAINKANPLSAGGPSGLRYLHLQIACRSHGAGDHLPRALAKLWTALLATPERFPPEFWALHSAANLTALGTKMRPIAVGDTLRRAFSSATLAAHKQQLSQVFKEANQFGVAVAGGVEHMATRLRLRHETGHWVFTLDCRNAFNSMKRASMLLPVAEVLPEALQYISHLYAGTPPQLLVQMADGSIEVVHSQRGAQQGDPFGPMLFSLGLLAAQRQFQAVEVPLGCYCTAYLDDMGVATLQLNRSSADSVKRLQRNMGAAGLDFVPAKSYALAPPGHVVTDAERALLAELGLTLAEQGIVSVGVPIGTRAFCEEYAASTLQRLNCVSLAKHLSNMVDYSQAAMLLLTQSQSRRLAYLSRNLDPVVLAATAMRYDALNLWTLEHVMGLPDSRSEAEFLPDMNADELVLEQHQQLQACMSLASGGLGMASAEHTKEAAYVGSLVATLPALLADLVGDAHGAAFRERIPHAATIRALWLALRALGPDGRRISVEGLNAILPPSWIEWALAEAYTVPTLEMLAAHDCPASGQRGGDAAVADLSATTAKKQAQLSHVLNKNRFNDFRRQLTTLPAVAAGHVESQPQAMARHRSQCGAGAMSWCTAKPSHELLTLTPTETRAALRRALGREDYLCPVCPTPTCTARDVDTRHARRCMRTGSATRQHHTMRDTLVSLLRGIGVVVAVEDGTPFTETESLKLMDIVMPANELHYSSVPLLRNRAALLDVTVADPQTNSALGGPILRSSAVQDGAAAAAAAAVKVTTYARTFRESSYKLWPMAVETFGRWGVDAEVVIDAMAEHAVGGRAGAAWRKKGSYKHYFKQVLAVTLQRTIHRTVTHFRNRVAAVAHGTALDEADQDLLAAVVDTPGH